jgi:hypothetical protein
MSAIYLLTSSGNQPLQIDTDADATPLTWWKSINSEAWRCYSEGVKPASSEYTELKLLSHLNGASHQEIGGFHYVVETDVSEVNDEEFNAWYDTEHLPGLAKVPGTISARRLIRLSGGPRYIACYDLVSPAVMESEAWLAIRHTAWSSRVRPMFFNTERTLFVRNVKTIP